MFEVVNNRRVIFGENKIEEIPGILEWYGKKKVFVGITNSIKNSEFYDKLCRLLKEKNIEVVTYNEFKGEPDLHVINNGRDVFLENNCDSSIAIGGGSVLDATKAIGLLATNGGMVEEYQMEGRQATTVPPFLIAVPTTSGTGSEATKVSVITNNYNGLKKSIYHNTMIADITILDPTLTVGLPPQLTAATGMDALSHAIESYVSLNANPISEMYGLKSMSLIRDSLVQAYNNPEDLEARGKMLLASYFGGMAITAGIGIAHIMAQPIGALYDIPHGDACSIFLPIAMEYNLDVATKKYKEIAEALGVADSTKTDRENGLKAIEYIRELREEINAPTVLKPYLKGEEPDMDFIIETINNTTGHVNCNPLTVNEELMKDVFMKALN